MESLDSAATKTTQELLVDDWNAKHDTGSPVWYWKGDRPGPRRAGVTTHPATGLGRALGHGEDRR